jgi:uncharacterized protein YjbI with pentapeptide repeats
VRDEERSVRQTKPGRRQKEETKQSRWGFRGKTVWDFLQLLIVPLMLAAIGFWFTAQQDARQQQTEIQRAEAERELAEQRAQDEALQAYLDQMSNLLLEKHLRTSEPDSAVNELARARTLTVLSRLDPSRKTDVMQFLVEARLVGEGPYGAYGAEGSSPIISLRNVDLSGAVLKGTGMRYTSALNNRTEFAFLGGADLRGANLSHAVLSGAWLRGTLLNYAVLSDANLSKAVLSEAFLGGADLSDANLSGAFMNGALLVDQEYFDPADLSDADLSDANLRGAFMTEVDLSDADLSDANLSDANLRGADLSNAVLRDANLRNADLSEVKGSPFVPNDAP